MRGTRAVRINPTRSYHVLVDGEERAIRYEHLSALEVAAAFVEAGHGDVDVRVRRILSQGIQ